MVVVEVRVIGSPPSTLWQAPRSRKRHLRAAPDRACDQRHECRASVASQDVVEGLAASSGVRRRAKSRLSLASSFTIYGHPQPLGSASEH